ncbi:MAG: acetyltransferase [Gemmatimonadales bacterium]
MTGSEAGRRGATQAEMVRAAVIQAAIAGFEDASMQGLCCEGAWEAAVSAMRLLDLGSAAPSD